MAVPYPCFLLPSDRDPDELVTRLAGDRSVRADPPCPVMRCYLDSSDGRLAAAGLALQAKQTGAVLGLVLEALGNGKPHASCRVERMPSRVDELGAGALRQTLGPLLGDTPLGVQVEVDAQVRGVQLTDGYTTVARLLIESGRCRNRPTGEWRPLAPRLTVVPVRAHPAVGEALCAGLAGEPGAQCCTGTRLAQAQRTLARAG